MADRLKAARLSAGYASAVDAARAFGWTESTYYGHENGDRLVSRRAAEQYGRAFGVDPGRLLFAQTSRSADGPRIRELRDAKGLSQTALGRAVGVSQPTIADIESGKTQSSSVLPLIASFLGVRIAELDPDYPDDILGLKLGMGQAKTAVEVMLEGLRPDLDDADRETLGKVFLDLALEPPDETIPANPKDQMRLRLQLLIRKYRPK